MTIDDKPLRVGSYNLLDGGVDEAGDRRWHAQLDILNALSLDVLAVQEAKHWDRDDFARLHATAGNAGGDGRTARSGATEVSSRLGGDADHAVVPERPDGALGLAVDDGRRAAALDTRPGSRNVTA